MAKLIMFVGYDGDRTELNDRLVRVSATEFASLFSGEDVVGSELVPKTLQSELVDRLSKGIVDLNSLVRFLKSQEKPDVK